MTLDEIETARIYPGIGVARVGDSCAFFVGPEVGGEQQLPHGGYKDQSGRLKRQAARFRIYGYDRQGHVVGELTADMNEVSITWNVHVANKKAAWYDFQFPLNTFDPTTSLWSSGAAPRRNPQISIENRWKLIIDAGCREIEGINQGPTDLDAGKFFGKQVLLGQIQTDERGRLIFLAGFGDSESIYDQAPTSFSNNVGWHDDIADGPVCAVVRLRDREVPVDPAWIITAPPNYAPNIVGAQTLYEVMYDVYVNWWFDRPSQPSFQRHILPILERLTDYQWVNRGFLERFGWHSPYNFRDQALIERLATPATQSTSANAQLRRDIYYSFRQPGRDRSTEPPFLWPPVYGSASDNFSGSIGSYFSYTRTNLRFLKDWNAGNFVADYGSANIGNRQSTDLPSAEELDRAPLDWCVGGPFHPGCELTWIVSQVILYRAPFRIRAKANTVDYEDYGPLLSPAVALADDGPLAASGPGDLTRWMAVPWQTDTASCAAGYEQNVDPNLPTFWPARVPNHVLNEATSKIVLDPGRPDKDRSAAFLLRVDFFRGLLGASYLDQLKLMIKNFGRLGVLEPVEVQTDHRGLQLPSVLYVEHGYGLEDNLGFTNGSSSQHKVDVWTRFGRRGGRS